MTPTHRVLAVSAVLLIASFAAAMRSGYAHTPLLPDPAADLQAELQQVGRSTRCGDLRRQHVLHYMVWKGGIRDGHDQAVEPDYKVMVATLRRIEWLSDRGECGG